MIKDKSKFSKYSVLKTNNFKNKKIWLYGYHSVKAAIENTNRKKYRLVCTKNGYNKLSNSVEKLNIKTNIKKRKKVEKRRQYCAFCFWRRLYLGGGLFKVGLQ